MQILNTSNLEWRIAKKTKSLRAKPMINLLVDKSIMAKFLIDTLEGKEPIAPDSIFCIGECNDAWQQSAKKVLAKYTVEAIDADGWMVCVPKPDNSVEFVELTTFFLEKNTDFRSGRTFITGLWGATVDDVPNLQEFEAGDFLARNRTDHTDQWIVRRKIWINSYVEISA
jgi:hypothetical protein